MLNRAKQKTTSKQLVLDRKAESSQGWEQNTKTTFISSLLISNSVLIRIHSIYTVNNAKFFAISSDRWIQLNILNKTVGGVLNQHGGPWKTPIGTGAAELLFQVSRNCVISQVGLGHYLESICSSRLQHLVFNSLKGNNLMSRMSSSPDLQGHWRPSSILHG